MRPVHPDLIEALGLLRRLAEFCPVVIGTPPLGIATESSDIDVACSTQDLGHFADVARDHFGHMESFSLRTARHLPDPAVIASFLAMEWEIELFCQRLATEDQWGVRHFRIEERLLRLGPQLREPVVRLKQDGLKTEPAFARILALPGDPYEALLGLETLADDDLRTMIEMAQVPGCTDPQCDAGFFSGRPRVTECAKDPGRHPVRAYFAEGAAQRPPIGGRSTKTRAP
ncbi:DUF4269 domain-containing protein [Roseospira marina]|uniref:DUF4269 domain-containing protein n=1 Tax=Roseospira marina TaxID=140057 RepID=A0A5M6I8I2_9PROT|nr:DUF4269 domain-containing protein [Roseospira marina]KAA5604237.1 DUF4269 domain-containing protein [Roseospira marina]MBB4315617.1 hypothetical protein [Roseospira marina]MBB5088613.1 hypothetical protein [Roseospira marina]